MSKQEQKPRRKKKQKGTYSLQVQDVKLDTASIFVKPERSKDNG